LSVGFDLYGRLVRKSYGEGHSERPRYTGFSTWMTLTHNFTFRNYASIGAVDVGIPILVLIMGLAVLWAGDGSPPRICIVLRLGNAPCSVELYEASLP
jgi:hypothetical protein